MKKVADKVQESILQIKKTLCRVWDGELHMIVVMQLLNHCNSAFGSKGELYQYEAADVLIAVYPPTKKRGWWTYATVELHKTGACECVMYSYQFEPGMIAHLANVASQVSQCWEIEQTRLQTGSVFHLDQPIVEQSALQMLLAAPLDFEEEGFAYYTDGHVVVRLMMLHAISVSEAEFLEQYGFEALEELFSRKEVDSLDVMRRPAIGGGNE
jgi:Suppressor of fused protein (SUFU)